MKKYLSIFMLFAGSTLKKLLILLLCMGIVETGFFYHGVNPTLSLDAVFSASHIPMISAVFFLLWEAVLLLHPFQKSGSTLHRLQLTPRKFFLCHAVYNALCCLIFWSFQVSLLLGLFRWVGTQLNETMFGPQSILLAFYRNGYLHSLLPLADWTRYLRNAGLLLGIGAMIALPLSRRGSRGSEIALVILSLLGLRAFPVSMGSVSLDLVLTLFGLAVFGLTIYMQSPDEEVEGILSPDNALVSSAGNEVNHHDA